MRNFRLTLADLAEISGKLRKLGGADDAMESIAAAIVRLLNETFNVGLVRLYRTTRVAHLPPDVRAFASTVSGGRALDDLTRCLILLATAGVEPAWNDRRSSRGHQAIPLTSVEAVTRLPMVAQLLVQLGFDVADVVSADPLLMLDKEQSTFNVFHVVEAAGSPFIPAQEFVSTYQIRSVVGFGGTLPDGELFAVIMFARVSVTRETAEMFKPLALACKVALMHAGAEKLYS